MNSDAQAAVDRPGGILVVDDDVELLALISFTLRNAGFHVTEARDGRGALDAFAREPPSLVVLDIMMPGVDGFQVCAAVRTRSSTPVIVLSARSDESDIVRALEIGADDYLTKPFSPRTLIARARAILRRSERREGPTLEVEGATLDVAQHLLRLGSLEIRLTPLETLLLRSLMQAPGRTVSTEKLVTDAWGRTGAEERHALKQVIYRLRRKLDDHTELANHLQTLRNAGYRWGAERFPLIHSRRPVDEDTTR
jgi:DNA-binding response OmpR family regulator